MARITKREYNDRMNNLKDSLQIVTDMLEHLQQKYSNNIQQYELDYSEAPEYWNNMHDLQYKIEEDINALESEWNTRDWTQQEWNEWELVSMNID